MSTQSANPSDQDDLAQFGYGQRLHRSLGGFATFAAGFSFCSVMTGVFQLFYFGFAFGGPAYWWSWPLVFIGQALICLLFAELAARYPIAGSVYSWAKQIGGPLVAWMGGFTMILTATVFVASVATALQLFLPAISPFFQFIGDGTGTYDFAENAVLLGSLAIVLATVLNAVGVTWMSRINSLGVLIELGAVSLLIILLVFHIKRGPGVVMSTDYAGASTAAGHQWGYLGAFFAASIASIYVLGGFDTASSLAEETADPRRKGPLSIMRAVVASGVIGTVLVVVALMSVGNIDAKELGLPSGGMPYVVKNVLGSTMGDIFIACVCISATVCVIAIMAGGIRVVFAMARDNTLPFSAGLSRVSVRSGAPIAPAVVMGATAILLLVLNIKQPQIFAVLSSVGTVFMYIAYLFVTVPLLRKRLRGSWPPEKETRELFSLGRFGLPVNVLAVAWGVFGVVNLIWPRQSIYNSVAPFHWYIQYGALIFVGCMFALGGLYYASSVRGRRVTILDHHRVGDRDDNVTGREAPAPSSAVAS